jgi:hypothetical protein
MGPFDYMDVKDWLIVLATLLSPLIAVQVSVYLQRRRDKEARKFQVFQALMASRAAVLAPRFVEALNMVDVAFYGRDRKSRATVEACRLYIEHHNQSTASETWGDKRSDLMVDMLQKMAVATGYEFDKVSIKNTSYFPRGYGDQEFENQQIRKLFLAVLKGERGFPVYVPSVPPAPTTDEQQIATTSGEPR